MAIAKGMFNLLCNLKKDYPKIMRGNALQLGRQSSFVTKEQYIQICKNFGLEFEKNFLDGVVDSYSLFKTLGFHKIESLDNSNYENADYILNLNKDVPQELYSKFDFIFDGGTSEHIFNMPKLLENIHNMLKDNGVIVHASPTHNYVEHGYYSINPSLFYDYYKENNYENLQSYLIELTRNHSIDPWLIRKYKPGCINKHSFSLWNSYQCLSIWHVSKKNVLSTFNKEPYQAKSIWLNSDITKEKVESLSKKNNRKDIFLFIKKLTPKKLKEIIRILFPNLIKYESSLPKIIYRF